MRLVELYFQALLQIAQFLKSELNNSAVNSDTDQLTFEQKKKLFKCLKNFPSA